MSDPNRLLGTGSHRLAQDLASKQTKFELPWRGIATPVGFMLGVSDGAHPMEGFAKGALLLRVDNGLVYRNDGDDETASWAQLADD